MKSIKSTKITSLLIANRGEIACRIIRSAKKMGMTTVAIATKDELNSQWCRLADQSYELTSVLGYRDQKQIIAIAKRSGCQAVHPGYGFLAESAEFAERVHKSSLIFVGPSSQLISKLGNKINARELAAKLNLPLLPSVECKTGNFSKIQKTADKIGYPLVVKAAAGGGGRGMRIVSSKRELKAQIEAAQREVKALFGDGSIYLERYLAGARHIEVQILGDMHGNVFHLYDRDCSAQRAYQKIVEEAPAPNLSSAARQSMYQAALALAKAAKYYSLGTVEFLVDKNEEFYFLEVNTRLQVEHPVTEEITGLDLVELQLRVAQAESLKQLEIRSFNQLGSSIEVRVCAEAAEDEFKPTPGKIEAFIVPGDIRTESGFTAGDIVSSRYDSLVAKLISHAPTRELALDRISKALDNFELYGIRTNIALLVAIIKSKSFTNAQATLNIIPECLKQLTKDNFNIELAAACFGIIKLQTTTNQKDTSAWQKKSAFRLFGSASYKFNCDVFDRVLALDIALQSDKLITCTVSTPESKTIKFNCEILDFKPSFAILTVNQQQIELRWHDSIQAKGSWLSFAKGWFCVKDTLPISKFHLPAETNLKVVSPLPGRIVSLDIKVGQRLSKDQIVAVIESMKMEHQIKVSTECLVEKVQIEVGQLVEAGTGIALLSRC